MSIINKINNTARDIFCHLSHIFNDHVRHSRLDNGIHIVTQPRILDQSLQFSILIQAGSSNDPEGQEGLGHFLEHILITPELARAMRDRSGFLNARTSSSTIEVFGEVQNTPENIEFILSAMTQLLSGTIDHESIERERVRILNEINREHDTPQRVVGFQTYANDDKPILGSHETVSAITQSNLETWAKEIFSKAQITIGMTGISNHAQLVTRANETIGKTGSPDRQKMNFQPPTPKDIHQFCNHLGQVYFGISTSFQAQTLKEKFIVGLARDILYDALHDRFTKDNGLAYHVEAGSSYITNHDGRLGITGDVRPEDFEKSINEAADVIAKMSISPDSIFKTLIKKRMDTIMGGKSIICKKPPGLLAEFFSDLSCVPTHRTVEKTILSIKPDDISDFILRRFQSDTTLIVRGPVGSTISGCDFSELVQKRIKHYQVKPTSRINYIAELFKSFRK